MTARRDGHEIPAFAGTTQTRACGRRGALRRRLDSCLRRNDDEGNEMTAEEGGMEVNERAHEAPDRMGAQRPSPLFPMRLVIPAQAGTYP